VSELSDLKNRLRQGFGERCSMFGSIAELHRLKTALDTIEWFLGEGSSRFKNHARMVLGMGQGSIECKPSPSRTPLA
jgi:hypothetical protein